MSNSDYRPRLCHLTQWPDYQGFGFNLHSEGGKPGQYIGKVDPGSPAEAAGLRERDRIIEVNYTPVREEKHRQVVARIKEGVTRNGVNYPNEVILLVVDAATEDYYKNQSLRISNADPNVMKLKTPERNKKNELRTTTTNGKFEPTDKNSGSYENDGEYIIPRSPNQTNKINSRPQHRVDSDDSSEQDKQEFRPSAATKNEYSDYVSSSVQMKTNGQSKPDSLPSTEHSDSSDPFNRTAAEFRQQLKEKRAQRRDSRVSKQMATKEKYDFVNQM